MVGQTSLFTDSNVRQHKGGGGENREQEEEAVFRNWLPSLSPLAGSLCEEFLSMDSVLGYEVCEFFMHDINTCIPLL
jgi:hypothetical protein